MIKYIEERGSPFSEACPPVLHNIVTKEVMTEEIRHDLLNASQIGKEKFEAFHSERIVTKTLKISEAIHRDNLKTMISTRSKPKTTTKKVIKEMNMTEKSIKTARGRGLTTEDLIKYDVVPSHMMFSDDGLMTKPEKSQLIRELENCLTSNDYVYQHKLESAFLIDVMATVRRVPVSRISHFNDLLAKLTQMTSAYHSYGRCDYIFDL